jgi:hypothetical protein
MHQQIRVELATPSSVQEGTGAMAAVPVEVDPLQIEAGALVRLLSVLADGGYDLRMAGGKSIETGGGKFVFAIEDNDDDNATTVCAAFLEDNGYRRRTEVLTPFTREVDNRKGALRDLLAELVSEGRQIDEVFVGTPRKGEPNRIPIQVTTIKTVSASRDQVEARPRASSASRR